DPSLPIPGPGSTNDLRQVGAVLEVLAPGLDGFTMTLPARGWRMGRRGSAYIFNGVQAHVVLALSKSPHRLTVAAQSTGLPLAGAVRTVAVRFTTGALRSCTRFARTSIHRHGARAFVAGKTPAPAVADCSSGSLLSDAE